MVNAICASYADALSHVDAVSSGRSRVRFPGPVGYFKGGFYGFLPSRVNVEVDLG